MLAQQAAKLVIAQSQQLRGGRLLELRALERSLEQLLLELGDGLAEVVRQLVVAQRGDDGGLRGAPARIEGARWRLRAPL